MAPDGAIGDNAGYSMLNLNVECHYTCFDLQVFSLIVFSMSYTLKYTVSRYYVLYAA